MPLHGGRSEADAVLGHGHLVRPRDVPRVAAVVVGAELADVAPVRVQPVVQGAGPPRRRRRRELRVQPVLKIGLEFSRVSNEHAHDHIFKLKF